MKALTRNLPWIFAGLGLALAAIYGFWPRPTEVDLAVAHRGPMQVTVDEDGKTRVRERYVVSAPLAGQLSRIELEPGDAVEAGKTLISTIEPVDPALIDDRTRAEAEARVRAAEAARQQAIARIAEMRESHESVIHEFERAKALRRSQAVTQAEFDRLEHDERRGAQAVRAAEFALQVAEYELEMAKAALIRTGVGASGEQSRERLELCSPVSGQVLRVFQESARVVDPGLPLLEVGDPSEMEVEIDVLSADAVRILPGAKVYLEHWGGDKPLEARVRLVEPAGFTKISALGVEEQRVNVIADFWGTPPANATLGDAFRVEARIVVWQSADVLQVPAGCLFRRGGAWAVFVVEGNRARLKVVEIGKNNGLQAEVLSGLNVDDRVILHPSDKISQGSKVSARRLPETPIN